MMRYLLVTFYAAMVAAGLIVEILFGALGLIPDERNAEVVEASVTWNHTTFLNLVFLGLAGVLVVRFLRTGGPAMLRMMDRAPDVEEEHAGPASTLERAECACARDLYVPDAGGALVIAGALPLVRDGPRH